MPQQNISAPRKLARKVKSKLKQMRKTPLNRFNVRTVKDASNVLVTLCVHAAKEQDKPATLVIGKDTEYRETIIAGLKAKGLTVEAQNSVESAILAGMEQVGVIALAETSGQNLFPMAKALLENPSARNIPLEYIELSYQENLPLTTHDRYGNGEFVSPLLSRFGSAFFDIYEESLTKFEKKTDIRDYIDLAQSLVSIADRKIPGAVAEFGSFKGHSGYLIRKTLDFLGEDRPLYMFDMFENFPTEEAGIDSFWSLTHHVNFDSVNAKFKEFSNVTLVKGDFVETLDQTPIEDLALIFIDCDAYRSTNYLLEKLWETKLKVGGLAVLEDYGHPQLLGNRLAAHQFFDNRKNSFTWFSQFSGFYQALKTANQ